MPKILFISYSHDSEQHKSWVKKFTDDLVALGDFEILLDQNLPKGFPLTRFMEQGLVNADKVLVIGTPQYKQKSEAGKGVAFEGSIISTELMQDIDTCKYYPILRSGTFETSFPVSLQARGGDDLSDDSKYDEMVRIVADSITNEKPIPAALLKSNTQVYQSREAVQALSQERRSALTEPYSLRSPYFARRCSRRRPRTTLPYARLAAVSLCTETGFPYELLTEQEALELFYKQRQCAAVQARRTQQQAELLP